jgi:hypothetical protein
MSETQAIVSSLVAFQFERFRNFPLVQAMSGRVGAADDGDLGYTPNNDHDRIDANRDAFLSAVRVSPDALTLGKQVHGTHVEVVTSDDRGRGRPPRFDGFPATDALVTEARDVVLGTIVADCVPLLVYDTRLHVVGLAHAGWRGTIGRIGERVVETMCTEFGSRPMDLIAGIGPSIGPCCYEVGQEVIQAWRDTAVSDHEQAIIRHNSSYHFDLWSANQLSLIEAGLAPEYIEQSCICTRCHSDQYFSFRAARAGLIPSGRMMMVAGLGAHP